MSGDRLCLLQVHAHPDDEASKGSGTAARYAAEGVHTVLVTCTGGEEGDVLNKEADTPEVRERLPEVRMQELRASVEALGYASLHLLGYRDSGMPESPSNEHPDCFAQADLDEATGRLVRVIRAERPQVVVTYGDDHSRYPHPDHIRTHEISARAFEAAGDPAAYPDAGEPYQPLKLYYTARSRARILAMHEALLARGEESPYQRWIERFADDDTPDRVTTRIDIGDHLEARRRSLLAHRTQISPDGPWFRVPDDFQREVFPWEEWFLARSLVDVDVPEGGFEHDLFAGVRERLGAPAGGA